MEMMRVSFVITVFALFLALVLPSISAQAPAPAPTSDGSALDQGVAYVLMLLALAVTYIIH
ncbi:hypothetical protein DCAR_0313590 [Daucus carota subsp. sativus]|uniref:Uncharacterized protein n=1 Tax=Daucus carota subsp. sativus TaxID=79200 RepID=A0A166C422_DAUCS|nr:hypothetical protein DCAR_0313590 [Daucus carota subsp. sativus]